MQKVIVILGQTATGKSNLAVKIAKKIGDKKGAEIISADSRQVYTHLDIGTGKITKKEMKGIPHHLLDVSKIKNKFTVVEFQKLSICAMDEIVKKGKIPIICGGTGFYIDAITKGVIFPEVPPNAKLRKQLYSKSVIALFEYLKKLDRKRAKDILDKNEQNNKVRLIRAIEIAKTLGKVPRAEELPPPYKFIKIGLHLPYPQLIKKIEKRVKEMFNTKNHGGLLNEIIKLKKPARQGGAGITDKRLKELGFEYYNPTQEKVVSGTLKYAKRQMTWFKRDKDIKWFKPNEQKAIFSFLKNELLQAK